MTQPSLILLSERVFQTLLDDLKVLCLKHKEAFWTFSCLTCFQGQVMLKMSWFCTMNLLTTSEGKRVYSCFG